MDAKCWGDFDEETRYLCNPRLSTIYKGMKSNHYKVVRMNNILNVDENYYQQ